MNPDAYLTHTRQDLDAFAGCLTADLSTPIEHCHGWTLYDLADHHGRGSLWTVAAITERRGDHQPPPAPRDPGALRSWFDAATDQLIDALSTDPATEAWTIYPPPTVGFWRRRRCHEALIHRWDVEHALAMDTPIDPELAGDGVAEVVDTMAPRQIQLGRAAEPRHAVRFAATDTGGAWVLGPGDPIATASGAAGDLLLMLWGRLPQQDAAIRWDGDAEAARAVLSEPLLP